MGGNVFEGQRRGEMLLGQLKNWDFREIDFFGFSSFFSATEEHSLSFFPSVFLSILFLIFGYVSFSSEIFIGVEGGSGDSASDLRGRSLSV